MLVIVIVFITETRSGWYCRDCGLAVYRKQQKFSLIAGWWGLPALVTLIALMQNSGQIAPFAALPAPSHDTELPPRAVARFGRPLSPGRPVSRSLALIPPILLAALFLIVCCGGRSFLQD
ncbi:hypothetical protein [Actinoplanes palleronii]|uniref:Uncharacterized protein n=1 Tax=Actinoplanes palleronii TaxID=113570 RepID=A0ABQ4BKJ2_9ACTN|nr:hypothetical protein [Actinoplanes palleronii]GIE71195.1 hypothetical protein Apa02nite_073030 [Actinoplanes palleronii]